MAPPIRIVMLGTGDFALPTFELLSETGHQVVALITQPDRPQGRKQELIPSEIKKSAQARGIRVEQPENVNSPEGIALVRSLDPELLITAAYGQILSADLLGIPSKGGINLHGSVLPSYRGAAPVARAIQKGEAESGVTVIFMTPRIDAGGMLAVAKTPIDPNETAGELEARLATLGAPLVVEVVQRIVEGTAQFQTQEQKRVTRAPKLRKEDGLIDWGLSSQAVHNLIRAMKPWPTASTVFRIPGQAEADPLRLIVHRSEPIAIDTQAASGTIVEAAGDRLVVATGEGGIRLLEVQIPGKKPVSAGDFLRGYRLSPGDRLGS